MADEAPDERQGGKRPKPSRRFKLSDIPGGWVTIITALFTLTGGIVGSFITSVWGEAQRSQAQIDLERLKFSASLEDQRHNFEVSLIEMVLSENIAEPLRFQGLLFLACVGLLPTHKEAILALGKLRDKTCETPDLASPSLGQSGLPAAAQIRSDVMAALMDALTDTLPVRREELTPTTKVTDPPVEVSANDWRIILARFEVNLQRVRSSYGFFVIKEQYVNETFELPLSEVAAYLAGKLAGQYLGTER
jgi:hypothetical protein